MNHEKDTHMVNAEATCCEEYSGASRRGFLKGMLAVAGAGVATSVHGGVFTQAAYAASGSASSVLVVLSLRGGADGLGMVVPYGDRNYYSARPRIGVPSDRLLAKDGMFGLHPSFSPLLPMWKAGRVAAVHATGIRIANRSHFAAMEAVEDADPGSAERRGWLNRFLGLTGGGGAIRGVQMGETILPSSLWGPEQAIATRDNASVRLYGPAEVDAARGRTASLRTTWGGARGPLGRSARAAMATVAAYAPVQKVGLKPQNGAKYPVGDLGTALAETARLLRADVGAEVVTVDFGGWDMHTSIGPSDRGQMYSRVLELSQGIAAFFTDLGGLGGKVTLVTISEFGRRIKENASQGLDHGHGNMMLLAGAGVRGGRYFGQWPGLGTGTDDDLAVTTDYRSVLREVLRARFQVDTNKVFPGFSGERVGAMLGQ